MKVKTDVNPETKLIKNALNRIDFEDTFSTVNKENSLEEIVLLIFGKSPKWVMYLMRFRNFLVRLVGIRVEIPKEIPFVFEVGSSIAFFEIYNVTESETILGADDSHLKFRVSVYNHPTDEYNIKVTTLVDYQNRLGRVYMFIVKPFHRLVVRRMVKQAYLAKKC